MLDEVGGMRLRSVERFAWHAHDGSPPNLAIGSVHLWFEDGRGVHLDTRADWTLRWSVSEPDDESWLESYAYGHDGRWTRRNASAEAPFATAIGNRLTGAVPLFNEVNEVVGVDLDFDGVMVTLSVWAGEIDLTPR